MQPLYELSQEYLIALSVDELDEAALDTIADKFEVKAVRVASYIKAQQGVSDYLLETIQKLQRRKNATDRRVERLRDYLARNMEAIGLSKVDDPLVPVSLQFTKSVAVFDESLVPFNYFRSRMEIDKQTLREALERGEIVEGATLQDTPFVRIG